MKAANLLISNEGVLQIADFGLARMFHEEPPQGEARREYTNMVVTRWYRPPELLLGERQYTAAIDLWGVGCILAEMYKGRPILQGASDIDQLDRIFRLCGTPNESTMPGWTLLPGCEGIRSFKNYPRQLEKEYERLGKDMASLLGGLLKLDPTRRYTAAEALDHEYFKNEPLLAKPEDLPHYDASHEFDKRRNQSGKQEVRPPKAPDAAGAMLNGNENGQAMAPREAGLPTRNSSTERRIQPAYHRRDRSRDYGSRYDDRDRREDRYRESYRDADRHRDRGRSSDYHYSRSKPSPSRRSPDDRYAPDPRDGRRRNHYDRPRWTERDDPPPRRARSRTSSRDRGRER